ncbi:site-specific DNA-methyltransferase [Brevibacillus brevis]|uniref:site-specific DNA-methyltransferase n=2 Tax=Brevibacillus brevis TaxID=1393 RepID=UPI000D10EC28|nr:site-specific DNA-methyltransferase [Brevibacillus brevis]PSJ66619.1 DNA modification methylase [Brevibacillus brevis]RED20913.1 DNA modification methylase [Brevibacillus brevis]VEF86624.1 DNA adenine methyltransferase YhdJ [Brevibacillus brevis]
MDIRKIPVFMIKAAEYNPRIDLQPGDPEYEKLKRSIQEFGYVEPLVWNERSGNLVGGHQRFKILVNELGRTEVDVSVVDLDDIKEKALNIALNKISGDWDEEMLAQVLTELQECDLDVELTGFDLDEVVDLINDYVNIEIDEPVKEDDFDIEDELSKIEEPVTRPGDLWILGRHRLLCGDSTNQSDVERLMDGKLAAMAFTDPPYNVDYTGKTKDALKIENDKMADGQFKEFLVTVYQNLFLVSEEGAPIYVCYAATEGANFKSAMKESGWLLKQCLVWVKNSFSIGRQDYHWRHEPILYGWKPGAAHRWYGDRKQDTVWEIDKPTRNGEHPTMKPIALVARALQNSSKRGDIAVDFFGGSGSTLVAAEQTERVAYLMEIDPKYCDVIVKRWEQLTGEIAVKA